MQNEKFTNELGNQIEICTSEHEIEGTPGILFSITGPTSKTEVHITRREAEVLHAQLMKILDT